MKKLSLCLLLVAVFLAGASIARSAELKEIGQADLSKMLAESKGKVVLLNFFATWCPPCKVEIPELVNTRKAYSQNDLVIIGLSVDEDAAPVPPFVEKNGINYPVYRANRNVTSHFGVTSVPHNVFYAKDGKMVISEPGMADSAILKQVIDDLLAEKQD